MNELIKSILEIKKAINPKVHEVHSEIKEKLGITLDVDDYARAKEIADILLNTRLPKSHICNSPDFKSLIISPDTDFYSKHNRETHTIILSEQLFTKEFRENHPFHRIATIPTLSELLVHEIAHSVDQGLRNKQNTEFETAFGWATTPLDGYASTLTTFLNVPKEKLTTIDSKERERIASKIKEEHFYQKPSKQMQLSWYGLTSPREDFAESYVNYVFNATNLQKIEPERYAFLRDKAFSGQEYIQNPISKVLLAGTDLDSPYGFVPGSGDYLKHRRAMIAERVKGLKEQMQRSNENAR